MIEMNDRATTLVAVMMGALIVLQVLMAVHVSWLRAKLDAKLDARMKEDRERGLSR